MYFHVLQDSCLNTMVEWIYAIMCNRLSNGHTVHSTEHWRTDKCKHIVLNSGPPSCLEEGLVGHGVP